MRCNEGSKVIGRVGRETVRQKRHEMKVRRVMRGSMRPNSFINHTPCCILVSICRKVDGISHGHVKWVSSLPSAHSTSLVSGMPSSVISKSSLSERGQHHEPLDGLH